MNSIQLIDYLCFNTIEYITQNKCLLDISLKQNALEFSPKMLYQTWKIQCILVYVACCSVLEFYFNEVYFALKKKTIFFGNIVITLLNDF